MFAVQTVWMGNKTFFNGEFIILSAQHVYRIYYKELLEFMAMFKIELFFFTVFVQSIHVSRSDESNISDWKSYIPIKGKISQLLVSMVWFKFIFGVN